MTMLNYVRLWGGNPRARGSEPFGGVRQSQFSNAT